MKYLLCFPVTLFLIINLQAQVADTTQFKEVQKIEQNQQSGLNADNVVKELKPRSSWEFAIALIVLIFGFLVLTLEVILVFKQKIKEENILKFIIVTLIITATLFLIAAGYNNNQIAPAMGLLGTIAGYLLGKQDK